MRDRTGPALQAPAGGAATERRADARHFLGCEVALRPVPDRGGPVHWAGAQNLSVGGIGLLLSCPFEYNDLLALDLFSRKGHVRWAVIGRVVHERTGPHGNTYLGCAFLDPLPEEGLRDLLR